MMYCLRSYIPLLLLPLPLSLSPVHLTILLALTYILNRPCIYCSLLLLILFASSCHWSNRCFIDFSYTPVSEGGFGIATWFIPRLYTSNNISADPSLRNGTSQDMTGFLLDVANNTVSALTNMAVEGVKNTLTRNATEAGGIPLENAGVGLGWLRSLFGRSEWTLPCTQVKIAL